MCFLDFWDLGPEAANTCFDVLVCFLLFVCGLFCLYRRRFSQTIERHCLSIICSQKVFKFIVFSYFLEIAARLAGRPGAATAKSATASSNGPTPTSLDPAIQHMKKCSREIRSQPCFSPQRGVKVRKATFQFRPRRGPVAVTVGPAWRSACGKLAFCLHETTSLRHFRS